MTTRIDAHHHVWTLARGDYGWLTPALAPIHRDFGLADLRPHVARAGITGTVLVQAAPTEAETRFMLEVAAASGGLVKGVVGWTDFAAADAPARIAALAQDRLLKGLRPMLQDLPDPAWVLDRRLDPAFRALLAHGLRFDALVKPPNLKPLRTLLDRWPDLPVVVDHGAKPGIAAGEWEPWASDIRAIAADGRTFCKVSGLATEAKADWRADDLRGYVDHLLACFGPARLMWGSDWPVVNLAGGYDRWWDAAAALLPEAGKPAILGGNAVRFYGL
ncbi:MAG: amidohydrolase family protein [Alphaproteobacteria bacterium]|nr:amidohydrolase family protein [Alphaproteobacteria bacterium]